MWYWTLFSRKINVWQSMKQKSGSRKFYQKRALLAKTIWERLHSVKIFPILKLPRFITTYRLGSRNFFNETSQFSERYSVQMQVDTRKKNSRIEVKYLSRCLNVQNTTCTLYFSTKGCATDVPEYLSWTCSIRWGKKRGNLKK